MSKLPTPSVPLPKDHYASDFQQARAKLLLQTLVGGLAVGGAAGVAWPAMMKATTNPIPVPEDLPGTDVVQIGQVGLPKKKPAPAPALTYKQGEEKPAAPAAPVPPASGFLDMAARPLAPAMPVENTHPALGAYGPGLMAAVGLPAMYFGAHGGLAISRHFENARRKAELADEEAKFDAARRIMYQRGRGIQKTATADDIQKIAARVLDDNDPLDKVYEQCKKVGDWTKFFNDTFAPGAAAAEQAIVGQPGAAATDGTAVDPSIRTMAGLGLAAFGLGGAAGAMYGATSTSPSTFEDLQKRILKRRLGVRDTKTYTPFTSTYAAPADAVTKDYIDPSTR